MQKVNRNGISLIVLVITIIVIVILAGSIILTLTNSNVIDKAREAAFKSNIKSIQEELSLYLASNMQNDGKYIYPERSNIKSADRYEKNILNFVEGKIVYKTSDASEKVQLESMGVIVDYTEGLVANLKMNGNALDSSGYNNNGTVNGAILGNDRFGKENSAYVFNGNSYISVLHNPLISFDETQSFTLGVWIKTTIGSNAFNSKILMKRRSWN